MTISGNLRSLELSELLQWLSQGRKTGTLLVRNGRVEKQIMLRNGRIISSASTDPREHLGEFLVSRGYVDRTTLDHARKLQEATQIFLGKVLVTLDSLSQVDLERVMREKTEESLYQLFLWREGDFEFLRDQLPKLAMVPLSLDVTQVVMEGLRRLDEHNREAAGEVEDRASVEARALERELETVPLADLVAAGAAPPPAVLETETLERAELREEALADLPATLQASAAGSPAVGSVAGAEPWDAAAEAVAPETERGPAGVETTAVEGAADAESLLVESGAYAGALASVSRRAVYLAASAILAAGAIGWGLFALRDAGAPEAASPIEAQPAATASLGGAEVEALAPPLDGAEGAPAGLPATSSPDAAGEEPEAAAGDAEALAAELDELVAARSRELESSLKAEYEAKLARLERQLDAARREADAVRRSEVASRSAATPAEEKATQAGSGEPPPAAEPAPQLPETAPVLGSTVLASSAPTASAARFAVQRGATPSGEALPEAPPAGRAAEEGDPGAVSADEERGETIVSSLAAGDPAPSVSAIPPPTPAPGIREGDLVERGPGVEAPRLLEQPRPAYPPAALRARRGGSVAVRVLVDEQGSVAEVRQVGEEVGLGFDKAALAAAASTRWQPATAQGVRVSTWVDLRIDFRP